MTIDPSAGSSSPSAQWLAWVTRLQAIAQTGLEFSHNDYDCERYEQVRRIAAEMAAASCGQTIPQVEEIFGRDSGYATPKVDVRAVVMREGKLLMVREALDGLWTLPGGWADVCASPAENAEREVFEESGYHVRAVRLLAVYDRALHPHEPPLPFHVYKLFFECELLGGEATTSNETTAVDWFGEDELPPLSTTRNTAGQLARMFEHLREPGGPTDFE